TKIKPQSISEIWAIRLKLQSINKLIGRQKVFKKEYEEIKKEYEEIKKEYEDLRRYFKQEENYTDVWNLPIIGGKENTKHPTQKPIKLIERIVRCSSRENNLVLDPFLGSGTTAVVCEKINRRWIGIEISDDFCNIAKRRIQEFVGRLFNG
ncbi:site-specific DNA-methyltransferase, partial [Candidatus Calescamantes bacterium]|nr:site-specific DNA-methyltransferase [Candidatus Calescamantes bacterium]